MSENITIEEFNKVLTTKMKDRLRNLAHVKKQKLTAVVQLRKYVDKKIGIVPDILSSKEYIDSL